MQSIKCVTVGDGAVGKTCMLISFIHNFTVQDYVPTVFDNFSRVVEMDGRQIRLNLWDTAGQENYDRIRPLSYPDSDVALICFAIETPASFKNVKCKWIPEIKHFCPNIKIILVGTKYDLRDNPKIIESLKATNERPITYNEGCLLAKQIGASKYVECSAIERDSVAKVFNAAVVAILYPPSSNKVRAFCSIL